MRKMSWAYIGGFFDGEGCLHHSKRRTRDYFASVTQLTRAAKVLHEMSAFLLARGIANSCRAFRVKGRGIAMTYLRITGRRAVRRFLRFVLPYLRVKRAEALVAIHVTK